MRNPWQSGSTGGPRRGRRRTGRSSSVSSEPPFDFGVADDDPVDLLAIRADDELLDLLAAGRPVGPHLASGYDPQRDSGFADDQQVLAMLRDWRSDVNAEPFGELVTIEEATKAIANGQRAARPRRLLLPVATAAAVAVFGLSGVAVAAGNAQPGDPLWGVSTLLNGQRAQSVEAAYRINTALTAAQQALSQGRVSEARVELARVQPDLQKVNDTQSRDELIRKSTNLMNTVRETPEGESVQTDPDGMPKDRNHDHDRGHRGGDQGSSQSSESGGSGSSGSSGGANSSTDQGGFGSLPNSEDPRNLRGGPGGGSGRDSTTREPKPSHQQPSPTPEPTPTHEPKPTKSPGQDGSSDSGTGHQQQSRPGQDHPVTTEHKSPQGSGGGDNQGGGSDHQGGGSDSRGGGSDSRGGGQNRGGGDGHGGNTDGPGGDGRGGGGDNLGGHGGGGNGGGGHGGFGGGGRGGGGGGGHGGGGRGGHAEGAPDPVVPGGNQTAGGPPVGTAAALTPAVVPAGPAKPLPPS